MRRGLLLIDRGSKEKEAKEELDFICKKVKEKGSYVFSNYCFLEVIPPFIEEGVKKCLNQQRQPDHIQQVFHPKHASNHLAGTAS